MQRLIDIQPLNKGRLPQLPRPLADDEPPRRAKDGTAFHNPDWNSGLSAPSCARYIKMAAELALQQGRVSVRIDCLFISLTL